MTWKFSIIPASLSPLIRFWILGTDNPHGWVRRGDIPLKLFLFRSDEVSLGTGSYQGGRRYGGEAEG